MPPSQRRRPTLPSPSLTPRPPWCSFIKDNECGRLAQLRRALVRLRARTGTVAEICCAVGFTSPAYFSTVFSRQFGYPPSEVGKQ